MTKSLQDEQPLRLFSDEFRTAVFVQDLVHAILDCLAFARQPDGSQYRAIAGHTFNVGGPDRQVVFFFFFFFVKKKREISF